MARDNTFGQWISQKLNPAQPSIAALEPFASPETIVDFEQAYREIEVVHRSVDMIINAMIRFLSLMVVLLKKLINFSTLSQILLRIEFVRLDVLFLTFNLMEMHSSTMMGQILSFTCKRR